MQVSIYRTARKVDVIPVPKEVCEAMRRVLTGEMSLEQVGCQSPLTKAYIGVMLMVAVDYQLGPDDKVIGGVAATLSKLTQSGIFGVDPHFTGDATILRWARTQGLHISLGRKRDGTRLVVPPEVSEVICHYGNEGVLKEYMRCVDPDFITVHLRPPERLHCPRCRLADSQLLVG